MNTYQISMSADICEHVHFSDFMWILEDLLIAEVEYDIESDGTFSVVVML